MSSPIQPSGTSRAGSVRRSASSLNAEATTWSTGRRILPAALAIEPAGQVQLVLLDQALARRGAAGAEERVGHAAADEQRVDPRQQALDDLDLVRHLGPAEDGDERAFLRLEGHPQVPQLLLHQQARDRRLHVVGDPLRRRVRAMRAAEGVVHEDGRPGVGDEAPRRSAGSFASSSLWKRTFSSISTPPSASGGRHRLHFAGRRSPPPSPTGWPSSSESRAAAGLQAERGIGSLLRPPEV